MPDPSGALPPGVDLACIHASTLPPFRALEMKRRCNRPTMLEIPGHRTQRGNSLLTDTELLIMAGAEGFEWIALGEPQDPSAVDRARRFLPSKTQVATTIARDDSEFLLPDLCAVADAIIVDTDALAQTHGSRQARSFVLRCALEANGRNTRCLVRARRLARPEEVEELASLMQQGIDGLMVDRSLDAVEAVRLRQTLDLRPTKRSPAKPRATARLGRGRIRMAMSSADDNAN